MTGQPALKFPYGNSDFYRISSQRQFYLDRTGAIPLLEEAGEQLLFLRPRRFGKTKYGLERTAKVILDLFTVKFLVSFSSKPIYLFGGAGGILMIISAMIMIYLFVRRIFFLVGVTGSPLFQTSVMFFILGFQSMLMGLIAELLVRTYHESQRKPTYTVRAKINLKDD
ncbi:MAG: hypothetical protein DCC59_00010 [Chloroflexi bacterium]|nr:MAG: hypothetical protein DCC59_00010 [Chloroflexota bacterium]